MFVVRTTHLVVRQYPRLLRVFSFSITTISRSSNSGLGAVDQLPAETVGSESKNDLFLGNSEV